MSGSHSGHAGGHGTGGAAVRRALGLVLAITAAYALAEVVGGWLANSLALLADAGHMLTDIMALGLALFAAWSAKRPPDLLRTYGYHRAEILAALFNGVTLIVLALFIFLEAWERLWRPPVIDYQLMGVVAFGGLLVNIAGALILRRHRHGLSVRAAYLHVLGDLLGSIGALVAAALIAVRHWYWADPAISMAIGGIIVFNAVRLVLESVNVLMEAAPSHLDTVQVRAGLLGVAGVGDVHDLHLWSLGGRLPLLSAHLVLDHTTPAARVLREATSMLERRFGITHVTLQVEPPDFNIVQRLSAVIEGTDEGRPDTM